MIPVPPPFFAVTSLPFPLSVIVPTPVIVSDIVPPTVLIAFVITVSVNVVSDFIVIASLDLIFRVVPDFADNIPDVVCKLKFVFAAMSILSSNEARNIFLRAERS